MPRSLSAEAREKAIAAAQQVIARDGVGGFTIDAVARSSGVAKTTIYRHFASGNELMIAAIDCLITPFPTPNTGSLAGDLEAFVDVVLPEVREPGMRRMMTGVLAAAASDPELGRIHQHLVRERMTPIRTILELARHRGEIDATVDLDLAMDFVEGPFFFRAIVREEPMTPATVRSLLAMVVAGLTQS